MLLVEGNNYRRNVSFKDIYINTNSIVSVLNHEGMSEYLVNENPEYSGYKFSLIKINNGSGAEEIIALGDPETILHSVIAPSERHLLNE
jgi:hypothetical protein